MHARKKDSPYVVGFILDYTFQVRNYTRESDHEVHVYFNREDGPQELDAFKKTAKKVRGRKVVSCQISIRNLHHPTKELTKANSIILPSTFAICRPPDRFDQEAGMRLALQKSIKQLMTAKGTDSSNPVLYNEEKGPYAKELLDRFVDRRYFKLLKEKEKDKGLVIENNPTKEIPF